MPQYRIRAAQSRIYRVSVTITADTLEQARAAYYCQNFDPDDPACEYVEESDGITHDEILED